MPNVNPSPQARFQSVPQNITQHRAMIERPSFDISADAAMIEYSARLSKGNVTSNEAMASGFKIQGAHEFLMVLKTLAEASPPPAARRDTDNLPNIDQLKKQ